MFTAFFPGTKADPNVHLIPENLDAFALDTLRDRRPTLGVVATFRSGYTC
jgi:hypothetical protein